MTSLLIIGEIGNGKSTLGNELLGYNAFKVSNDTEPGTNAIIGKEGIKDNLFVIDTPGVTNIVENENNMYQLIECLKQNKKLNAILLIFNYQQTLFSPDIKTLIKLLYTIFPKKNIDKHIALIFTNSFTKRGAVSHEQKIAKINKILPEYKKCIEEVTGIKVGNFVFGFVDIDQEEGIDENGKMDLERIIKWASSLDNLCDEYKNKITKYEYLELKDENEKLKEEIDRIKIDMVFKEKKYEKEFEIIKNEISELKNKLNQH